MLRVLLENEENMRKLRGDLTPYYSHFEINKREIDSNTISIVMTASDRSKQTYFTISTIAASKNKNIHLVVVDDSTEDSLNQESLEKYGIYTDFIRIKRDKKFWVNPCVNYNIGFLFMKGERVMIQNAEVCHIGDILESVRENHNPSYFVFNVTSSRNLETNEKIYALEDVTYVGTHKEEFCGDWLQHHTKMDRGYHFLSFTSRKNIETIKGFSWDYSFGIWYDDDDFLKKIRYHNIPVTNVIQEETLIGLHLYHTMAKSTAQNTSLKTQDLFESKCACIAYFNKYVECSDKIQSHDEYVECVHKLFSRTI